MPLPDAGPLDLNVNVPQFEQAFGVDVDSAGRLFITEGYRDAIWLIDPASSSSSIVAGDNDVGSSNGTCGPPDTSCFSHFQSAFNGPEGLAIEPNGAIDVADTLNCRIRRVTTQGSCSVTTLAGTDCGVSASTQSDQQLYQPAALAVAPDGGLFIADTLNDRIALLDSQGHLSTIAGVLGAPGLVNGSGASAQLNHPSGLAVGTQGVLYVADTLNNSIRVLVPPSPP